MEMFKQDAEGAMVYKHEEVKQMISIKSGTGDVTILSDHFSPPSPHPSSHALLLFLVTLCLR